jgi:hypothetical protein
MNTHLEEKRGLQVAARHAAHVPVRAQRPAERPVRLQQLQRAHHALEGQVVG